MIINHLENYTPHTKTIVSVLKDLNILSPRKIPGQQKTVILRLMFKMTGKQI